MTNKKISGLTSASTPLAGTEVLPIVQSGATVKVSVANLTAGRTTNAFQYTSTVSESSQQAISCISANLNTVVTNGSYAGYSATNTPESTTAWIFLTVTSNGTDQIYQTCAIAGYVNGQTYKRFSANSGATWTSWVLISANTTGNFVQTIAGTGINFTANTPAAGMSSQLLNWYEEGIWTTAMTADGGSVTLTYDKLNYTRSGRIVTISGEIVINSVSAPTGDIYISLPFTNSANTSGRSGIWSCYLGAAYTFTGTPGGPMLGLMNGGATKMTIRVGNNAGGAAASGFLTAGTTFDLGFTYQCQ